MQLPAWLRLCVLSRDNVLAVRARGDTQTAEAACLVAKLLSLRFCECSKENAPLLRAASSACCFVKRAASAVRVRAHVCCSRMHARSSTICPLFIPVPAGLMASQAKHWLDLRLQQLAQHLGRSMHAASLIVLVHRAASNSIACCFVKRAASLSVLLR